MLQGCVPVVILLFWSRIPPSHGYLHPTLWGCIPIVIFLISVNSLMGTYTLCCGDVSPWSYFVSDSWAPPPYTVGMHPCGCIFILDSVISLGTYTHLVCLVRHHCHFRSHSHSHPCSALILDSWAPPPTISSICHF